MENIVDLKLKSVQHKYDNGTQLQMLGLFISPVMLRASYCCRQTNPSWTQICQPDNAILHPECKSTDFHCCALWWVKSAKMGQLLFCVNAYWNMQWNWNKTWQLPAVLVPKTSWVICWCPPSHNMNPWLRWGLSEEKWSHVELPRPISCSFCLTVAAASLEVWHCLELLLLCSTDRRWLYQNSYLQLQPNLFYLS